MPRPRGTKQQREAEQRLAVGKGKLIGYIRVSTVEQGTRGHSLDGQRKRIADTAEREGYELLDVICEVESGAKERDGLQDAQDRIEAGEAEGLIFPKLDRVGRSQLHLARLIEWARKRGVTMISTDEGLQVYQGELKNEALPFLIALAQVERERISRRTKEGLAAAKSKGVRLGRPAENSGELEQRAANLRKQGQTLQAIADTLNREGHRTARGDEFKPTTIYRMVNRVAPEANPVGGFSSSPKEAGAVAA